MPNFWRTGRRVVHERKAETFKRKYNETLMETEAKKEAAWFLLS